MGSAYSRDGIIGAGGTSSQPPRCLQSLDVLSEQEPTFHSTVPLTRIEEEVAGVNLRDGEVIDIMRIAEPNSTDSYDIPSVVAADRNVETAANEASHADTPVNTALMDSLMQMNRYNRNVEAHLRHCGYWIQMTKAFDHTFLISVDEAFTSLGQETYSKFENEDGRKRLADLYKIMWFASKIAMVERRGTIEVDG